MWSLFADEYNEVDLSESCHKHEVQINRGVARDLNHLGSIPIGWPLTADFETAFFRAKLVFILAV